MDSVGEGPSGFAWSSRGDRPAASTLPTLRSRSCSSSLVSHISNLIFSQHDLQTSLPADFTACRVFFLTTLWAKDCFSRRFIRGSPPRPSLFSTVFYGASIFVDWRNLIAANGLCNNGEIDLIPSGAAGETAALGMRPLAQAPR